MERRSLVFVLVWGLAAAAIAGGAPPPQAGVTPSPAATSAPRPALGAGLTRAIVGLVVSVDLAARTVSIRESVTSTHQKGQAEKRPVTVAVDARTDILRGKRRIELADLKPFDLVVARYLVTPLGAQALSVRAADIVVPDSTAATASASHPAETGAPR